jgi:hypothetical protein
LPAPTRIHCWYFSGTGRHTQNPVSQAIHRQPGSRKCKLLLEVPSENGPDRTLRLTQRPEFAFTEFRGVAPLVVAGEIDVLPAER